MKLRRMLLLSVAVLVTGCSSDSSPPQAQNNVPSPPSVSPPTPGSPPTPATPDAGKSSATNGGGAATASADSAPGKAPMPPGGIAASSGTPRIGPGGGAAGGAGLAPPSTPPGGAPSATPGTVPGSAPPGAANGGQTKAPPFGTPNAAGGLGKAPVPPAGDDPNEPPLAKVQRLARAGKLPEALDVLRGAVAKDEKNRQLVMVLTAFTQQYAWEQMKAKNEAATTPLLIESAKFAHRMVKEFSPLQPQERDLIATAFYNEACIFAKDNKSDEAIQSMKDAVEVGFKDLAMLDADEDFKLIRDGDAFKQWRTEVEATIAEAARKEVIEKLAANKPFTFSFTLNDLEGQTRTLADLKGKVVLVDVWGTWCPPCRQAIPHLVALHKKYQAEGVEIIGINYEGGKPEELEADIAKVRDFVKANGITYTCVMGDEATQKQIPDFQGFPTMLIIDREGQVRMKHVGFAPGTQVELDNVVKYLLTEKKE